MVDLQGDNREVVAVMTQTRVRSIRSEMSNSEQRQLGGNQEQLCWSSLPFSHWSPKLREHRGISLAQLLCFLCCKCGLGKDLFDSLIEWRGQKRSCWVSAFKSECVHHAARSGHEQLEKKIHFGLFTKSVIVGWQLLMNVPTYQGVNQGMLTV